MTGPEHYQAAENDLQEASRFHNSEDPDRAEYYLAKAQVHATLAQAAAIALGQATETDRTNWRLAMRND